MIHGHGDDAFRYVGKIRINFSTNIYQGIDHSKLRSHLYALGDVFRNYPEPEPRSIETLLANRMGIDPECVIVTTEPPNQSICLPSSSMMDCQLYVPLHSVNIRMLAIYSITG